MSEKETSIFEDMDEIKALADEILENEHEPEEPDFDEQEHYSRMEGEYADFYGFR
jgi:hypothetical protein